MAAPYTPPKSEENFDKKLINNRDWIDKEILKENKLLLRRNSIQALFKQYNYDKSSIVRDSKMV
jgi:tmRNA-binding protein